MKGAGKGAAKNACLKIAKMPLSKAEDLSADAVNIGLLGANPEGLEPNAAPHHLRRELPSTCTFLLPIDAFAVFF